VYREQGDFDQAEAALVVSLALARELGSTWQAGVILFYLASVFLYQAKAAGARLRE
jgi:hypothetical protein